MSRFLRERLRAMAPYVPGEQPRDTERLIKLNTNENPFPPAPGVRRVLDDAAVRRLRLYNDIDAKDLKRALADRFGVLPEQVFAGNGSDEVLALSLLAFGGGGAAYPDVTYGFYRVWTALFGVSARVVPVREDFSVAPEDYRGLPGLLLLANPNAPTSLCLPLPAVRELLRQDGGRLVLADEAYVAFSGQPSAATLLPEHDNLLVVGTLSKSHSLAGARLGYALGSPELIADLDRVKFSFHPYNVNSLTQLAAAAAVRDETYFARCRDEIVRVRDASAAALAEMGFRVLPSAANFLFVRPPMGAGEAYMRHLRQNNILVRHFDEERTRGWLRITVGTAEQMDALLRVTRGYLG